MKEFIIYQKEDTKIYIHKGARNVWRNGKWRPTKLYWYGIRKDDDTGYGDLLGIIKFDGGWRQYVTHFEPSTKWSSGCKKKICEFEDMLNIKWRQSIRK